MKCRHCHAELRHVFLDLGAAPPSNAYLAAEDLGRPEPAYPLRLFVCVCNRQPMWSAGQLKVTLPAL